MLPLTWVEEDASVSSPISLSTCGRRRGAENEKMQEFNPHVTPQKCGQITTYFSKKGQSHPPVRLAPDLPTVGFSPRLGWEGSRLLRNRKTNRRRAVSTARRRRHDKPFQGSHLQHVEGQLLRGGLRQTFPRRLPPPLQRCRYILRRHRRSLRRIPSRNSHLDRGAGTAQSASGGSVVGYLQHCIDALVPAPGIRGRAVH